MLHEATSPISSFYCNMICCTAMFQIITAEATCSHWLPIFSQYRDRLSYCLKRTFRAGAHLAGFQEHNSRTDPFAKRTTFLCARWTYKARYLSKRSSQNKAFCHERGMSRSYPKFPRSTHETRGTMTPSFGDEEQFAFSDSGSPTEVQVTCVSGISNNTYCSKFICSVWRTSGENLNSASFWEFVMKGS